MIKVVYGPERFLVKRAVSQFKKQAVAEDAGYEVSTEWSRELADNAIPGFFTNYVHVTLQDAKPLVQTNFGLDQSANILITLQVSPNATQSKELVRLGFQLVSCGKLKASEVRNYVSAFVYKNGMRITEDACECLISRVGYFEDDSVCLENILNELKKFIGVTADITTDVVEQYVEQSSFYNAFSLSSLIERGDRAGAYGLAEKVFCAKDAKSELIRMCGLLQQPYRVAYKAAHCPKGMDVRTSLDVKRAPRKMPAVAAGNGTALCAETVQQIKTGGNARTAFLLLIERLMNL